MSFERVLRSLRRRASALVELSWHCGFRAVSRVLPSRAQPWSTTGTERVLVIAPHPDDEAIACSGTILRHIESGDAVVVAVATDGSRSRAAATSGEMAAIRRNEAELAARRLGIERLEWLGLPEGAWHISALEKLLCEQLQRHEPTIVYAPSRVDFHPEHLAVAHALARALDARAVARATPRRVRAYQVQVPLTRILTNVITDVSNVLAASVAALAAYSSQRGSIESVHRRRRYGALAHRVPGPVEEFWELSVQEYAELHRSPFGEWSSTFRGVRRFAWTDPLAYLQGNAERRRLRSRVAGRGVPA